MQQRRTDSDIEPCRVDADAAALHHGGHAAGQVQKISVVVGYSFQGSAVKVEGAARSGGAGIPNSEERQRPAVQVDGGLVGSKPEHATSGITACGVTSRFAEVEQSAAKGERGLAAGIRAHQDTARDVHRATVDNDRAIGGSIIAAEAYA